MTDTDDLARQLFRLEPGARTTALVTAQITQAVVEWAATHGWATRTEARVGVGAQTRLGFVDVVVLRGPQLPDLAVEIDSTHKPWSVTKLRHAISAGMEGIWIRWGDDEWAGSFDDIDVIQLPLGRHAAARDKNARQMLIWS